MKFDYTESQRQIAPAGEYQLRCKSKKHESSKAGKPMITIDWIPFNGPSNVPFDQYDRCIIRTWVSLQENALFTLKNLAAASKIQVTCASCNTDYDANIEKCPSCGSLVFEIDPDFIDTAQPHAHVKVEKNQAGTADVNVIESYY